MNAHLFTIPSLRTFSKKVLKALISIPALIMMGITAIIFGIAAAFNQWSNLPVFAGLISIVCIIFSVAKDKDICGHPDLIQDPKNKKIALLVSIVLPLLSTLVIIRPWTNTIINGKAHQGFVGLVIPFVTDVEPLKQENQLTFTVYGETADNIKVSATVTTRAHLTEDTQQWKPTEIAKAEAQRVIQKCFASTLKDINSKDIGNTLKIEFGTGSQAELADTGLVLKGALKVTDIHATF